MEAPTDKKVVENHSRIVSGNLAALPSKLVSLGMYLLFTLDNLDYLLFT